MAKMSNKTKRAINKGRRKAGLKPIKFKSSVGIKEKRLKSGFGKITMRSRQKIKKSGIGNW